MTFHDASPAKIAICNSFLSLLKQYTFDKITVREIISCAYVNRSTFYKYFDGKFSLLNYIENCFFDGLHTLLDEACSPDVMQEEPPFFVSYFSYIESHQELYKLLLEKAPDFEARQRQSLYNYSYTHAEARESILGVDNCISHELSALMISSLYSALFVNWVKNGMSYSKEEMGRIIQIFWKRFASYDIPPDLQ